MSGIIGKASNRITAHAKGAQKHQNGSTWKSDKFKSDGVTKMLKNMKVINCCQKCTSVIDWKIKYGKYKPLSKPSKCLECEGKCVKYAYHTRCIPCVEKLKRCSKCGEKKAEFVHNTPLTQAEESRKEADLAMDLKALPERRRRTFLRYLNGKKKAKKVAVGEEEEGEGETEEDVMSPEEKEAEAKEKLQKMKVKYGREGGGFDLDDFDDEDLDGLNLDSDLGSDED